MTLEQMFNNYEEINGYLTYYDVARTGDFATVWKHDGGCKHMLRGLRFGRGVQVIVTFNQFDKPLVEVTWVTVCDEVKRSRANYAPTPVDQLFDGAKLNTLAERLFHVVNVVAMDSTRKEFYYNLARNVKLTNFSVKMVDVDGVTVASDYSSRFESELLSTLVVVDHKARDHRELLRTAWRGRCMMFPELGELNDLDAVSNYVEQRGFEPVLREENLLMVRATWATLVFEQGDGQLWMTYGGSWANVISTNRRNVVNDYSRTTMIAVKKKLKLIEQLMD